MNEFKIKTSYQLEDVSSLIARLRDPECGCPWDRVQTHESIRQNLIEEAYEVADAIDRSDHIALKEELGDLLLQVVLHSEMERQCGRFDLDDVADGICSKLVFRHPHLFGTGNAKDSESVLSVWEDIKRVEKDQHTGTDAIRAVPRALPALMRAQKILKRAAYAGYEPFRDGAEPSLEALACWTQDVETREEAIGSLLLAVCSLSQQSGIDAELALTKACERFADRFETLEGICDITRIPVQERNAFWRSGDNKSTEDINL